MHCALARPTDDPCFAPERLSDEDMSAAGNEMRAQAARAREHLRRALADASEAQAALMNRFIDSGSLCDDAIAALRSLVRPYGLEG